MKNGVYAPETVLACLQAAGEACLDRLGAGCERLHRQGILRIIIGTEYTIEPGCGAPVAEAELTGLNLFLMELSYIISDGTGRKIGTGRAIWSLMDAQTRKSASTGCLHISAFGRPSIPRIRPVPTAAESVSVTVGAELLDINDHVNNARMARWFTPDVPVAGLAVVYRREIRGGERVVLRKTAENGTFLAEGRVDGVLCFEAAITPIQTSDPVI